jgi:arylsulfatase
VDGVLAYAYNRYGRDLTTIRADRPLTPGEHEVVLGFHYAGGPPGDAAAVTLLVDGDEVGSGELAATTAYYFAFDETCNVGVDRGTPVTDDYPAVRNRFTGTVHGVRFDLGPDMELGPEARRTMAMLVAD